MQVQPRVPIDETYVRAWETHDAVDFVRLWITGEVDQGPHVEHTGNLVAEVPGPGELVMHWTPTPALANLSGNVHGGYIALVCDEACGIAAATVGGKFIPMLTLDLDVTYLRPAVVGQLHRVEGSVVHSGRTRSVVEARIFTPAGKLVATARGSFVQNTTFVDTVRASRS